MKNHASHALLSAPGEADITADVDFSLLSRVGQTNGVTVKGPVDQGIFLQTVFTHTYIHKIHLLTHSHTLSSNYLSLTYYFLYHFVSLSLAICSVGNCASTGASSWEAARRQGAWDYQCMWALSPSGAHGRSFQGTRVRLKGLNGPNRLLTLLLISVQPILHFCSSVHLFQLTHNKLSSSCSVSSFASRTSDRMRVLRSFHVCCAFSLALICCINYWY